MVRWQDGVYGGVIAGVANAAFYAVLGSVFHDGPASEFFGDIARGVPGLHGAPGAPPIIGLGVVLHFVISIVFGVIYALLARHVRSMWRAPTSVAWGLTYGLITWFLLADVLVPISGAENVQPLWEGLVGNLLFYGVFLSEYITIAHRREAAEVAEG